jgi:hypothetical protein
LITGGAFVAYAGLKQMGFKSLGYSAMDAGPVGMFNLLPGLTSRPDFWIWFYLTFTVSSTMLPSSSDRKSWLTIGIWLGMLLLISLLVGVGPWLLNNVTPVINRIMTSIAVVFLISDVVHFLLWLPSWLFHRLLNKLTGLEVTNQKS